jgi:hypothetical protein
MIGMRFPPESVAQILLWMFDAVENPAYMRSVTACPAAITPVSVPSYVWTTLPSLRPSRSRTSRTTTLLNFGTRRLNKRDFLSPFAVAMMRIPPRDKDRILPSRCR